MDRSEIIAVPFPPSSNMCYPTITKGKKTIRVKSKRLKDWLLSCADHSNIEPFNKCFITYRIFFPDDAIRDGQSYMKPTLDYIVSQGILEDDNRRIVKGEMWIDCDIDRKNPRIEILIKEVK